MHIRNLKRLVLALCTTGLLTVGTVFVQSLSPSAGSDAALPRIPTTDMAIESFRFTPHHDQQSEPDQILWVRTREGHLFAWRVLVRGGALRLPDTHWWKPGLACHDFRPDFRSRLIQCFDRGLPDWAYARYRWRLDGRSLSDQSPDMEAVPGTEESGHFVLHKH
jgi:hypothetical protein